MQDTLLQYLKITPAFESAAHEKAWLLRTAANLSKNKIKYNRIRTTDELNKELIAAIVGRGESTVRSDLTRARKRLKILLKEAYDFE